MRTEPVPAPLFGHTQQHCASSVPLLVAFLWGLAEATLFFIVPDVYLGLVALFHWRKGLLAAAAAVAGAMLGGAIMYALAAANGLEVNQLLDRVPLIGPELIRTVNEQMQGSGLRAMVDAPLKGIPYKLYAAQAGQQQLPFIPFLLVTILARLERLLPFTLLCGAFGVAFRTFIQRRTRLVLGAYALFWVGVYISYYFRFR